MNSPKLRFKEFNGALKATPLKNITISLEAGVSVNSKDSPANDNEFGVLKTSCISKGSFFPNENKSVLQEEMHRVKKSVKKDTIVISRMNTPQLVGEIGYIDENYDNLFLPDRLWELLPDKKLINTRWLSLILTSPKYMFLIRSLGTGTSGSMKNIAKSDILDLIINIPDIQEQNKLALFFEKIDSKIQLQQEKIDLLKEQKKGYVEKLFPKKGSVQPELRFQGFSDNWEQKELKDVGNFMRTSIDPQTTPDSVFVEYSMPSFDNGRLPERVVGKSMQSMRLKISGEVLLINKLNVRQKRIWLIKDAEDNAVASSEFMPFTSRLINLTFLEQLMLSDRMTRDLEAISSGTSNSQKRITPTDLLKYQIKIPRNIEEQKKIGDFLSKIDLKISLMKKELDALQTQKQAFMQQMFI